MGFLIASFIIALVCLCVGVTLKCSYALIKKRLTPRYTSVEKGK